MCAFHTLRQAVDGRQPPTKWITWPRWHRQASSFGGGPKSNYGEGQGGGEGREGTVFSKYSGAASAALCGAGVFALWLNLDEHVAHADFVPRRFLTTIDFSAPIRPMPSKIYPYIIIAHPRAIVAQAALETLTRCDPEAEVFVVADRYNFDDQQGSRLYTGAFGKRKDSSSQPDAAGRQMITAFTTGQGKAHDSVPNLPPLPQNVHDKKNVHICQDAHVTKLDVEEKVVILSDGRVLGFGKVRMQPLCKYTSARTNEQTHIPKKTFASHVRKPSPHKYMPRYEEKHHLTSTTNRCCWPQDAARLGCRASPIPSSIT